MHLLDLPLELLIHVLSSLPIRHMQSLMLVNTGWRWLVQQFLSRKYHITLLPYIKDPSSFRDVLRRSHSVISGSFALEFSLHGTTRPPINVGDIEIYAGVANTITIIEHLRREEGYLAIPLSILPCISYIDDYDGGIAAVVRMLHPRGTKIDVICSLRISALHPITFFWSTAIMSFLTSDGFCSAYHALTERGIACLNPSRDLTPRIRRCITKYEQRGFKIGRFDLNEETPHTAVVLECFGGDEACLTRPYRNFRGVVHMYLASSATRVHFTYGSVPEHKGILFLSHLKSQNGSWEVNNVAVVDLFRTVACYLMRVLSNPPFSLYEIVRHHGLNTLLHQYDPPLRAVLVRNRNPATHIVPDSEVNIHQFLQVVSALDSVHDLPFPFHVVYRSQLPLPMQFNVPVQGIVAGACLDPFGETLSDIDDSDPLQWLQLTWGYPQFKTKFDAQASHLKIIIDACYAQLGLQAPSTEILPLLSLRRRVYRSVNHALRLDELLDDGSLVMCNPNQFYRRDLVEAIATVDIAVEPAEDTVPRTSIYLSFNRVTCVLYANKLEQLSMLAGEECQLPSKDELLNHRSTANMGWHAPLLTVSFYSMKQVSEKNDEICGESGGAMNWGRGESSSRNWNRSNTVPRVNMRHSLSINGTPSGNSKRESPDRGAWFRIVYRTLQFGFSVVKIELSELLIYHFEHSLEFLFSLYQSYHVYAFGKTSYHARIHSANASPRLRYPTAPPPSPIQRHRPPRDNFCSHEIISPLSLPTSVPWNNSFEPLVEHEVQQEMSSGRFYPTTNDSPVLIPRPDTPRPSPHFSSPTFPRLDSTMRSIINTVPQSSDTARDYSRVVTEAYDAPRGYTLRAVIEDEAVEASADEESPESDSADAEAVEGLLALAGTPDDSSDCDSEVTNEPFGDSDDGFIVDDEEVEEEEDDDEYDGDDSCAATVGSDVDRADESDDVDGPPAEWINGYREYEIERIISHHVFPEATYFLGDSTLPNMATSANSTCFVGVLSLRETQWPDQTNKRSSSRWRATGDCYYTYKNNDIFHARQDAAQARLSLNQSIQDYVGQHGEHLARQSTLNNQIQDCYDNIVAFLNLSAGYRDNVDALLEEMEESVRKWTFYRPDMPMEKLATAEEQIKWLREQSAVPILPKLADATDNTDHVPNKVMDETTGSAAQDDEWPSLQQVYDWIMYRTLAHGAGTLGATRSVSRVPCDLFLQLCEVASNDPEDTLWWGLLVIEVRPQNYRLSIHLLTALTISTVPRPDILRRSREELIILRERDAKWTRLVDLLEDKLRCVQWHLHNEKGERMKVDADIICLRRALGPSSLTLLRDRLTTEETRPPQLHTRPPPDLSSMLPSLLPAPDLVIRPTQPPQTRHVLPSRPALQSEDRSVIPPTSYPSAPYQDHPSQTSAPLQSQARRVASEVPSSLPSQASSDEVSPIPAARLPMLRLRLRTPPSLDELSTPKRQRLSHERSRAPSPTTTRPMAALLPPHPATASGSSGDIGDPRKVKR
ncbi:uncharacterized protein STEHIDRAFT_111872 [Stereum hirsutum FP-91666 SS1]|uniref:uncharacterized protein n=1 Tax=Stereum hirsutum (strain FP-91666) TaxID=721885 RepID=UPI0004449496|nr:uncharacterized protein STEHIDRAFT_111872 [Stereum hirsutum FP-91666 SS1]EIM85261.1 hypothetical protein STEHIDRAFT_111872 [Stereum hirsutum FP-91666 SS1]